MGDATLTRIGTEVDGDPAMACAHMAEWWPVYCRLVWLECAVEIEILQAQGSYSKSGKTHVEGTAIDWRTWRFTYTTVTRMVRIAREMGARATWYRTRKQGFDPHTHSALDCPCRSGADYQTAAVDAGYNGLGPSGRGYRDDGPKPSAKRDYRAGIIWAKARIAALTTPTPQEDDMPLTQADAILVADTLLQRHVNKSGLTVGVALENTGQRNTSAKIDELLKRDLGASGPKVDVALQSTYVMVAQLTGRVAGLTEAIAQIAAGQSIDLAAVEAAAKRGVEDGLAGARVVVELGD